MDEQQLSQLSVVCEQAVVQGSSGALAQINEFFATDVLSKCELVLRSDGSGEYGHVVAATVLHDYLLEHDAILSIDIKIGIRKSTHHRFQTRDRGASRSSDSDHQARRQRRT
ncbi:hypothetical protein CAOG_009329 [Capsaspora owczarzaki ATCC 30864]|uniref:Uncharacterized protein n=1 Tax=Capsaspora owczarzaki (strain ATCC 30864) TaxID=595528 RepID=A0A0D2X0K2_CAPO3|nr:hypothetical protein CAOG_009329 [Capsaspora owczarzaki ATCC 30864]